jgi:hypothetical protein
MVLQKSTRLLALASALALALPAAADAKSGGPSAHAAGGDPVPANPSVVGVPIQRTDKALSNAADAVDAGNGAQAVGPLTASRRYLLRSYAGAKYLIANPPPAPPAEADSATAGKFLKAARRAIRTSRARGARKGGWIHAQASGDLPAGPAFADGPTAVFNVLTSQYAAATAVVGMTPDAKGQLLVKTTLNTALVLRNRLVKVVHAAAPPAPAEADSVKARASQEEGVTTFDMVMPGLIALIDDEQQQMKAAAADPSVPAESKAALTSAMAADQQIENLVNQYWPPVPAAD